MPEIDESRLGPQVKVCVKNTFISDFEDHEDGCNGVSNDEAPSLQRAVTVPPDWKPPDSCDQPHPSSISKIDALQIEESYEDAANWKWADPSCTPMVYCITDSSAVAAASMAGNMGVMYQVPQVPVMMPMMVPVMVDSQQPNIGSGYVQPPSPRPASHWSNNAPWPPPPPESAPTVERVKSGGIGPPAWSADSAAAAGMNLQEDNTEHQAATPATSSAAPASTPADGLPLVPQQPSLSRSKSLGSNVERIRWHADGRKLKRSDKQIVSQAFKLSLGNEFEDVDFKMMIYPKVTSDTKGGASFVKAQGKGMIQVKCESELTCEGESAPATCVRYRIGIGRMNTDGTRPRGPVMHDFAQCAVAGLPKELETWNFLEALDESSMTFAVVLEIVRDDPSGNQ
jgi:hypothetical protein